MKLSLDREKLKPILIMLGVLTALALPLMFFLEDFVRDAIVLPLSYYAWYFGVIINALPQSLLVGALVLLLIYVAGRSLRRRQTTVWKPRTQHRQLSGTVRIWTDRINMVSQGDYSRERFEHQFGQLLIHLLAHEERMSLREIVRRVQTDEMEVPPELDRYLRRALASGVTSRRTFFGWLKRILTRRTPKDAALRRVAADVEPALLYLERQLRIVHGEDLDGP